MSEFLKVDSDILIDPVVVMFNYFSEDFLIWNDESFAVLWNQVKLRKFVDYLGKGTRWSKLKILFFQTPKGSLTEKCQGEIVCNCKQPLNI